MGLGLPFVPEPYSDPIKVLLRWEPWYSGPRGLQGDRANPKKERGALQPRVRRRSSGKGPRCQAEAAPPRAGSGTAEPNPRAPLHASRGDDSIDRDQFPSTAATMQRTVRDE